MRFKDPKTGTRLASIEAAFTAFCQGRYCCDEGAGTCPMCKLLEGNGALAGRKQCLAWAKANPAAFAKLVGYEVIEDKTCSTCKHNDPDDIEVCRACDADADKWEQKEDDMEKNETRLAEVLGVSAGKEFYIGIDGASYGPYVLNEKGNDVFHVLAECSICIEHLIYAINHPESIIRTPRRTPRLTESEIAIMKAVGAKYVSINKTKGHNDATLWTGDPTPAFEGASDVRFYPNKDAEVISYINGALFPSVHPGECLGLE